MIRFLRKWRCKSSILERIKEASVSRVDFLLFHISNNLSRAIGFMEAIDASVVSKRDSIYLTIEVLSELLDAEVSSLNELEKTEWLEIKGHLFSSETSVELHNPYLVHQRLNVMIKNRGGFEMPDHKSL